MSRAFVVVLTTVPNQLQAHRLTQLLLKKRLVACVNLMGPVRSFFWWQGKVDRAREYLLLIKTRTAQFSQLQKMIEKNHPYSVPEIIALPILKGNKPYLDWLRESVR